MERVFVKQLNKCQYDVTILYTAIGLQVNNPLKTFQKNRSALILLGAFRSAKCRGTIRLEICPVSAIR